MYTPTMPGLGAEDDRADVRLEHSVAALVDYIASVICTTSCCWVTAGVVSWCPGRHKRIPDRIERLVYWSAFVPLTGESLIDLCPPAYGDMFRGSAQASRDNSVMFPFEVFAAAFMQDASEDVMQVVHPLLERQPFHTMDDSLDLDDRARLELPSVYLKSDDDMALPPGEFGWDRFVERLLRAPRCCTPPEVTRPS